MNGTLLGTTVVHTICVLISFILVGSRANFYPLNKRHKPSLILGIASICFYGVVIILFNHPTIITVLSAYTNYIIRSALLILINVVYTFRISRLFLQHKRQKALQHKRGHNPSEFRVNFVCFYQYQSVCFLCGYFALMLYPFLRVLGNKQMHRNMEHVDVTLYYDYVVLALFTLCYLIFCLLLSFYF